MADLPDHPGYFWLRGPGREPQPVEVGWENEHEPEDKGCLVIRRFGIDTQGPLSDLGPDDQLIPFNYP